MPGDFPDPSNVLTMIRATGNYQFAFCIFSKELRVGKMHRSYLIFVFFSVYAWSGLGVEAQPRLYGCSRYEFETYSEAERRPVIRYLDAARELADKSVKLFVEGRIDALYSGLSPSFKEVHSEKEFRENLAESERPTGKVLGYEYHEQWFTYSDPGNIDVHNGFATTRYAAQTSGWDGTVIIEVLTSQRGAVPEFLGIGILRSDANTPVDKIFPKATGKPCPWIRSPLTIKAIN